MIGFQENALFTSVNPFTGLRLLLLRSPDPGVLPSVTFLRSLWCAWRHFLRPVCLSAPPLHDLHQLSSLSVHCVTTALPFSTEQIALNPLAPALLPSGAPALHFLCQPSRSVSLSNLLWHHTLPQSGWLQPWTSIISQLLGLKSSG